jgi:hypothetical protein
LQQVFGELLTGVPLLKWSNGGLFQMSNSTSPMITVSSDAQQ